MQPRALFRPSKAEAVVIAATLALASAPDAATAQAAPAEFTVHDCKDDHGADICTSAQWEAFAAKFDLSPAESLQQAGVRGVRVFYGDGYSYDMPAITVLSQGAIGGSQPAELEVRRPASRGRKPRPAASLARDAWDGPRRVAGQLQTLVARAPARKTDGSDQLYESEEGPIVCSHSWVVMVESLTDAGVERRIRSTCGDDELVDVAFKLTGLALSGFAHCNHLDPGAYRNASTQLQRCLSVEGVDLIGAADVTRLLDSSWRSGLPTLATHLGDEVVLTWAGGRAEGADAVRDAITGTAFADLEFYTGPHVGLNGEVRVTGELARDPYEDTAAVASMQQVWRREDGRWILSEMRVEPFAPLDE